MIPIYRSPAAEQELQDIWLAIAINNPTAATRMLHTIANRINRLATHPRLGPRRPEIAPSARVLVEGPYLILFEIWPDTDDGVVERVDVIRVVDGRRNLSTAL
ncbi:MAG: type II toxin-antitoxin system RelE/ParE family toxin [Azospirillaceae bacterium]|nr:type II toxin-antitoxin system RelE/ParE family toxin [Azospirillaceae bacterium]